MSYSFDFKHRFGEHVKQRIALMAHDIAALDEMSECLAKSINAATETGKFNDKQSNELAIKVIKILSNYI